MSDNSYSKAFLLITQRGNANHLQFKGTENDLADNLDVQIINLFTWLNWIVTSELIKDSEYFQTERFQTEFCLKFLTIMLISIMK